MAENGYEKTPTNTVVRRKQRGLYDYKTINSLIDATPVLHVAFNPSDDAEEAFPVVLPMLGCTGLFSDQDADPAITRQHIYLHGAVQARLMKLPSDGSAGPGVPVTVSATLLDGIILALTPFNHSCNYRSAVAFGHAHLVTDNAEKMYAMERVTNNIIPQRWDNSRVPTKAELTSTGILRVEVVSASAKVHVGGPSDDRKDLKDENVVGKIWTGVVPTWLQYGPLLEGNENRVTKVPGYLSDWVEAEKKKNEKEAFDALVDVDGKRAVR